MRKSDGFDQRHGPGSGSILHIHRPFAMKIIVILIYSNTITEKGLYGFCSYSDHDADSITVTARGTLGVANYRNHKFIAIGRVVSKPKEPLDGRFFSEFINNRIEFVVESTGVPQLTAPQISKYTLPVPPLPEQTAIADVLSDMDAEIAALEAKLRQRPARSSRA